MPFRFAFGRPPAVAAHAMVATSQPLATRGRAPNARARRQRRRRGARGGRRPLRDRADVDRDRRRLLRARVARRRARRPGFGRPGAGCAEHLEPVAETGPRSVTVPGAVAGWAALAERHGRLGLDTCLADAIHAAEHGFAVAPLTAAAWAESPAPEELGPVPAVGQRVRLPELAVRCGDRARWARRLLPRPGRPRDRGRELAREDDLASSGRPGSSRSGSRTAATRSSSFRRRPRASPRSRRSAFSRGSSRRFGTR